MRQSLTDAVRCLSSISQEEAYLEAQLLLMAVTGMTRESLFQNLTQDISPANEEVLHQLLARRLRREPLPYIIRRRFFFGLEFYVDGRVLIPRPESELLVEKALQIAEEKGIHLAADVGTGSGAIAVSLAVNLPHTLFYATDISSPALEVAAINCRRHGVQERVHLLQGDLVDPLPHAVDLLVANLPYISHVTLPTLAPEIRHFEPAIALDGGEDGLHCIARFLATAGPKLRPGGALLIEIGESQKQEAVPIARKYFPKSEIVVIPDLAGKDRVLLVRTDALIP